MENTRDKVECLLSDLKSKRNDIDTLNTFLHIDFASIEIKLVLKNLVNSILESSKFILSNQQNVLQNMVSIRFVFEGLITMLLLEQDDIHIFRLYYDALSCEKKSIDYRKKQLEQEIEVLTKLRNQRILDDEALIDMSIEEKEKQEEEELDFFRKVIEENFLIHTSFSDLYDNGLNYQIDCLKRKGIPFYEAKLKAISDSQQMFLQDIKNVSTFKNKNAEEIHKILTKRIHWREKARQANLENEYNYIYGFSSSLSHFSGYSLLTSNTFELNEEEMILRRLEIYLRDIIANIKILISKYQTPNGIKTYHIIGEN